MAFRDLRKSRKWLSAEDLRFLTLVLFGLILLLAVNIMLARTLPGGEWLFQRWSGARAFLATRAEAAGEGLRGARRMPEGLPVSLSEPAQPYSTEIAQRTQEVAYGRRAFSSEYAYVLNDPFFIVLLYTPLAFFRDFTIARGIWMTLAEIVLAATVVIALNLAEWRPPGWLYVLLLGFGLFSYFSLNALVTGTPAIFLAFLYGCILLALRSHSDEQAGALLALVAYQWEVGSLFFLFILFLAVSKRHWGVLAGLGMALSVLLVVSFMTYQGWGLPYIRAVISAWLRGMSFSFGHLLSVWFPDLRFPLGGIISVALGVMLFLEWLASVKSHYRRVVWTACLSLAITPLIGFAIFPTNHVVLLLPFILILALVWERWQRRRALFTVIVLILVLLIPFGLYLRSVYIYDPIVTDLLTLIPPIAAIIGLYWMRWWVLRSARPWFDQFGEHR